MQTRRQQGSHAETQAAAFIERHGLSVYRCNWQCRYGEIDIIAKDGNSWVFVEVRMRRDAPSAVTSIGPRKRQRLLNTAQAFLQTQPDFSSHSMWRYDVVIVTPRGITHIPHAFEMA